MAEKLKFEIYAKNCGYVTNSKKFLKRTAPVNSEGSVSTFKEIVLISGNLGVDKDACRKW